MMFEITLKRGLFWVGLLVLCGLPELASAQSQTTQPIRVVAVETVPFFYREGTRYAGFTAEIWDAISAEMDTPYTVEFVESFPEQFDMLEADEADVAAMNISITVEREKRVDFTHMIFNDGFQIVVPAGATKLPSLWLMFRQTTLFQFLGWTAIVVLAVAHIVWFIERSAENSDFHPTYLRGIWDGVWWALVTMTTVGYGRQEPQRVVGRIFAIGWMFAGLAFFSLFMAEITSAITIGGLSTGIAGPNDLQELTVGTNAGSVYEMFLLSDGVAVKSYETSDEMWQGLADGEVDAVLTGHARASFYSKNEGAGNVKLTGSTFFRDANAFALQEDSPYQEDINRAFYTIRENGTFDSIYIRWLGD